MYWVIVFPVFFFSLSLIYVQIGLDLKLISSQGVDA